MTARMTAGAITAGARADARVADGAVDAGHASQR
jgi:hypothetical protein